MDLEALQAIEAAQDAFDKRLTESFKAAFTEVEGLGYPGVTDPRPRVSTRLKAIDGLNHNAAITFEVDVVAEDEVMIPLLRLPEANNGLGYQNLISIFFRLMSYRDAWMRVGKASKGVAPTKTQPLHLVLVEEPEGRAMGQDLHGCATTTAALRRAIRHNQESLKALANRYRINPKTSPSGKIGRAPTI